MTDTLASYLLVAVAILLVGTAALTLIHAYRRRRSNTPADPVVTGFNAHVQSELTHARTQLDAAHRTIEELRTELERNRTGPHNAG